VERVTQSLTMRCGRTSGVRCGFLVACLLSLSGCQFPLTLWVISGSQARHLVFGISDRREGVEPVRPSSVRVYRCADIYDRGDRGYYPPDPQLVWSALSQTDSGVTGTTRITYGHAPAGLRNGLAPQPLEIPGCYVVLAYALDIRGDLRSATVGFRVLPNGRVEEMSRHAHAQIFSQHKPV